MSEYLCPNCVTPWKCNGPHIPEAAQGAAPRAEGLPSTLDIPNPYRPDTMSWITFEEGQLAALDYLRGAAPRAEGLPSVEALAEALAYADRTDDDPARWYSGEVTYGDYEDHARAVLARLSRPSEGAAPLDFGDLSAAPAYSEGAAPRAEGLPSTLDIPNPYRPDTMSWITFEEGQLAALDYLRGAAPRAEWLAASPSALDVERLEKALVNLDLPAARMTSRAICDEYARLTEQEERG